MLRDAVPNLDPKAAESLGDGCCTFELDFQRRTNKKMRCGIILRQRRG